MPNLSVRSASIPASPIRKLASAADGARARGLNVFQLNIGQPDVSAPDEFWEGIRRYSHRYVPYSHSAGIAPLREKAAEVYRRRGIDVTADQVMVTTAGSEALQMAMIAGLNPGDEVIVPEPMYANYIGFAAITDVEVVAIPTKIEENFALSTEEFEKRITPRTKAILICNPGNPTGRVYADEQILALGELAKAHDLFLIGDEVYRDFNYTGRPVRSVLQIPGLDDHAIMVDSASKRYSLCGSRVGFLVSRNSGVMDVALRYGMARLSSPTLEMEGVLAALDAPDSYTDQVVEEYTRRRDVLVARLSAMPGVLVPQIDGAFYATVRLPVDDADAFCLWMLESFSHEGNTVQMAPAAGFYATEGSGRDEVRIAYVLEVPKLEAAMDALEVALRQYPGRTN
ncbi:MAG: pyridoxal phosphate-dependent aminotransferase [Fimbriimonadaceae bacterium]|nr:pyridoxal phosphate-dependent aminotransferase [Fimbriimonadaceae bacterium]